MQAKMDGSTTAVDLRLSPVERVISWRLASGRCISSEELIFALYGDATGGADCASNSIYVRFVSLRKKFTRYGIDIHNRRDFGWFISPEDLPAFRNLIAAEIAINVKSRYEPKIRKPWKPSGTVLQPFPFD